MEGKVMPAQPQLEDGNGGGHPGIKAVASHGHSTQGERLE